MPRDLLGLSTGAEYKRGSLRWFTWLGCSLEGETGSYLTHEAGYPSSCKLGLAVQEDHVKIISIVSVWEG